MDHATGVVIGATARVGARTTLYHQVTLGAAKAVPRGQKRHPTVGDDCIVGEDFGWFGIIYVDFGWYMHKAVCKGVASDRRGRLYRR
jgi:serine O-acetyltransferase